MHRFCPPLRRKYAFGRLLRRALGLTLFIASFPAQSAPASAPELPEAEGARRRQVDELYRSLTAPANGGGASRYIRGAHQNGDTESELPAVGDYRRGAPAASRVLLPETNEAADPVRRTTPPRSEAAPPAQPQPTEARPASPSNQEIRRSRLLDEELQPPPAPEPPRASAIEPPRSLPPAQTPPARPPARTTQSQPANTEARRPLIESPPTSPAAPATQARPSNRTPLKPRAASAPLVDEPILMASAQAPGLPGDLRPTERNGFHTEAPRFYRGIYLTSYTARTPARYRPLLDKGARAGLNVLVVDVQPRPPAKEFLDLARSHGYYLVARVVVFEGGLREYPPPQAHLAKVLDAAEHAARHGFAEVQLDYIRFADRMRFQLSQRRRYEVVTGIIKLATERLRPYRVRVGADTFGRISFNRNDPIGQKIEVFAPHLDTLYPMLYPSHFYGDPNRQRDPYGTIYDGVRNTMNRAGPDTRVIAYIQSFTMKVGLSGLSYEAYIRKQIDAARASGGAGFVAWNARNDYAAFFRALERHDAATAQ